MIAQPDIVPDCISCLIFRSFYAIFFVYVFVQYMYVCIASATVAFLP